MKTPLFIHNTLGALFSLLSITVVQADAPSKSCIDKAESCTPLELCAAATSSANSGLVWSEDGKKIRHVLLAKKFGMGCGVINSQQACISDPSRCSVLQLCEVAIDSNVSGKFWREDRKAHKALIDKFGIDCGNYNTDTSHQTEFGHCDNSNPEYCLDEELCEIATYLESGSPANIRRWNIGAVFQVAVAEARRRNLSCSVGETAQLTSAFSTSSSNLCSLKSPESCHDTELCIMATYTRPGQTEVRVWRTTQNRSKAVEEAKARLLNCGVNIRFAERLPKYAVFTHQTGEFKSQVSVGVVDASGRWNGERFYWWPNGSAKYFHGWSHDMEIRSDATFDTVYPLLKQGFQALEINDRKGLQIHLTKKGLYSGTIDGAWGKNTLLSLVSYSALRLHTVNLNSQRTVTTLLEELRADTSIGKVISASDVSLSRANRYVFKDKQANTTTPLSELRMSFENSDLTFRMQIQYGLKVLGYYKDSVDGQWGSKTSAALSAFRTSSNLQALDLTSTAAILKKLVDVPDSFTIIRQRTKPQREVKDAELFGTYTNNQQFAAPNREKTKRSGEVLFGLPD